MAKLVLRWYSSSIQELEVFFGVSTQIGLSAAEVRRRLHKNSVNTDPILPEAVWPLYKAKVWRSGQPITVTLAHIVEGDLIELTAGDRVPADIRLVKVNKLQVDESRITGASHIVTKNTLICSDKTPLDAQKNMLFLGSIVTSGSGLGVVVALGDNTVASKYVKPRTSITQKRLIKKLKKFGVITQNHRAFASRSNKRIVAVVEAPIAAHEAGSFIHKNPKRAGRYVFVLQKEYAGVFASTLQADIYHVGVSRPLEDQQVVATHSTADTIAVITALQARKNRVLLVTNQSTKTPAMLAADFVLHTDTNTPDSVKLTADFLAKNADINTIEKLVLILDK